MFSQSKTHLASVKESYFEHQKFAFKFAFGCFAAGFMALIHGLIPALFEKAASEQVKIMADRCENRS